MKKTLRLIITGVQIAALFIATGLIIHRGMDADWATVAAALAVIAALIANLNSQRISWRQEDEFEPELQVQYDLKSRNSMVLISIHNVGGSNAYEVNLNFEPVLLNLIGEPVTLSNVPCIAKDERIQIMVYGTPEFFAEIEKGNMKEVQYGHISYKKNKNSKLRTSKHFSISIMHYKRSISPETDQEVFYQSAAKLNDTLISINKTLNLMSKNKS